MYLDMKVKSRVKSWKSWIVNYVQLNYSETHFATDWWLSISNCHVRKWSYFETSVYFIVFLCFNYYAYVKYIYNEPFLSLQDEMRLLIINCLNKHLNIKYRLDYYRSVRLTLLFNHNYLFGKLQSRWMVLVK